MSAWFLYLNSVRANLMSQNPELDICGITRLASGHWRDLAHEKRSVFEDRARELKEAYDVEMKEYNKRHKTPKKTAKQRKGRIDVLVDQYFAEINSKRKQPEQKEPQTTTKRTKLSPTDCNMPRKERTLTPAVIKELQSKETVLLLMLPDHSVMNFQVCLAPPKDENAHWPVEEMIESMRCMSHDYPALSSACEQAEDAKSCFDMESMKHSVELFNATMMFVNPSNGDGSVPLVPTPPNAAQTSFIQNQVYRRVVTDASTLNRYSSFSDEVYGEAQHPLISELIATVPITKEMTFIDLGSGIGQVVMQMAAQAQCKMSHGIELSETPAKYAKQLEVEFRGLMQQYGKSHGDFNLISGNFLDPEVLTPSMLNEADVLFVNNVAFGAETNQQLLERFSALKEGTKIVSMRSFATQVGGRGRLQSNGPISKEFRFRCSCGVTGVTASANRKDLVDCIQCGVWQHRRCTGVVTEEQSKSHLCDKCHRYMKKQVSMQDGMSMNVLGPFYSKAQNAVSWTSAPVSYFIHTIGKQCEPTKKVEEKQVEEPEEPQAVVSVQEVKEQVAPEEVAN